MITLAVEVEFEAWAAAGDVEALARRAAEATMARRAPGTPGHVSADLLLSDDAAVRAMNRAWRGQDKPTNVLSFPAPPQPLLPGCPRHLGDVALAYETVAREATAEGKSLADHASHLVVHGLLHLLGHDHEREADAVAMEREEAAILASLGIPDPYGPDPGRDAAPSA